MILTSEQSAAIDVKGKIIVSASAGSGKTFVMIQKLVNLVTDGADLDEILAVTFTKKAAAQMKEKLRDTIIERIESASEEEKARLKNQLVKIPTANISTIHSYCKKLITTYFYALDVDAGFDVISSDDSAAKDLMDRAIDEVFEKYYDEDDEDFRHLLSCFMRKRSDGALKEFIFEAYRAVRKTARYRSLLQNVLSLYTEEGFDAVCEDYRREAELIYDNLYRAVEDFQKDFVITNKPEVYERILEEMKESINACKALSPFDCKPPLSITTKPKVIEEVREADDAFKEFKSNIKTKYDKVYSGWGNRDEERERFLKSGVTAAAFTKALLAFDEAYSAVKAEENKLDYNDLEHLTLRLLENEGIRKEINSSFKYAYVDEYQDVNPVQEEIISALTCDCFLVGDVKQAIYGFRGSKSKFFSEKFESFANGAESALKLSKNFRSSDAVLDFTNRLFSDIMRPESCGIDYKREAQMCGGGLYPEGYGYTGVHIIGEEEKGEREFDVYSVKKDKQNSRHTREGRAVLSIVRRELNSMHYDLKKEVTLTTETGATVRKRGDFVKTKPSDICILTRKNSNASVKGIVRALTDAGYSVSGADEPNICDYAEVKQMLDILSLIDNSAQDIPLITALLSPLGGFTEEELAQIKIATGGTRSSDNISFAECCDKYARIPGVISQKLGIFRGKLEKLRDYADILNTGELIDLLLSDFELENGYGVDSERKTRNVLRLAEEGASLPLAAFLEKIRVGENKVSGSAAAPSDSIKIMSMHASKGLEFPVVILADICRTFKGDDYCEIPFDEKYGFAPKCFDRERMLALPTVLRRLVKLRSDKEELKNEYNLFYVACTRAMCNLHVLAAKEKPYDLTRAFKAECYADMFDISKFNPQPAALFEEFDKNSQSPNVSHPDEALAKDIELGFEREYSHSESVNLPVKSSASAILKLYDDEPVYVSHALFGGEGETSTQKGTAYHRFLELCDFKVKTADGIRAELTRFLAEGSISREQFELLNADELAEILAMPAFDGFDGAELFREQEFLCRLRANEILETDAEDYVLVQGAIDLLVRGNKGIKIIDYKYSHKSDEQLVETYKRQLELYKKATARITGAEESKIKAVIVNIFKKRQINLF